MNICICTYTHMYTTTPYTQKNHSVHKHFEPTWNIHINKLYRKINFKRPEMSKKTNKNSLSTTLIFGKMQNLGKRMKKKNRLITKKQ